MPERPTRFSASFRRFLWTRLLGSAANQILMVALAWQIYDLTGSAFDLGLVGLAQFVPALLLTLPAGHWVDRADRRRVLAAALLLQAVAGLVLGMGSVAGWVDRAMIFAMCVVMGVARALQMPSQQAIVPALVPIEQLPRAFAASSTLLKIAVIGGPVLGGFLYAFGPQVAYFTCLAFLVVSISYIATIPRIRPAGEASPISVASLLAGVAFIWRKKQVLGAISLDLFAVLLGGATALLPIYAKEILATGPWGLGLLRAAPAAGALVVGLVLAQRPLARHVGRRMFAAVAIYGAAILVFAVSRDFALSFAALAVSGAADMVSVVVRQTLVQLDTPDDMRGRVSAVNSVFIGASNELGEFRAGTMAAWIGPIAATLVGGAGTLLVAALWMRGFPALARRDRLFDRGT
ncbi:MAG TPA: MFS transporter [Casimicrobiaceae bacterium]|nr:MFS transporter [Casimicrobiaceae bacterium]